MDVVLRIATVEDAAAVNETYGYYIEHSLANFGEYNKTVKPLPILMSISISL